MWSGSPGVAPHAPCPVGYGDRRGDSGCVGGRVGTVGVGGLRVGRGRDQKRVWSGHQTIPYTCTVHTHTPVSRAHTLVHLYRTHTLTPVPHTHTCAAHTHTCTVYTRRPVPCTHSRTPVPPYLAHLCTGYTLSSVHTHTYSVHSCTHPHPSLHRPYPTLPSVVTRFPSPSDPYPTPPEPLPGTILRVGPRVPGVPGP